MIETLIEKYVDAFPIAVSYLSESGVRAYFLRMEGSSRWLYVADTTSPEPWATARRVCNVDFANGTFYPVKEDGVGRYLYVAHDPSNREYVNIYRIHLDRGDFEKITHETNVMTMTFTKDFKRGFFKDQKKLEDGTFVCTVFEIDLVTLETKKIFDDAAWTDRLGWGVPVKMNDDEKLLVGTDWMNQRKRQNILLYDLKTGEREKLIPQDWETGEPRLSEREVEGGKFLFGCEKPGGFRNYYEYDLKTRTIRPFTEFGRKMEGGIMRIRADGSRWLDALFENGDGGFELIRTDSRKGELGRWQLPANGYLFETDDAVWMTETTNERVSSLVRRDLLTLEATRDIAIALRPRQELEHIDAEKVAIPSFDGEKVPAYLLKPRGPLKGALVVAFYGGEDYYNRHYQMFAELGIAVLSPAVRGSWGFGYDWEKKLEGDLGGAEILDVIECARWLEKRLQLPPKKIGVYGSSHGGYATLRALTMPETFRGVNSRYPFGFAIAEAGFADLVDFFKSSRISDWLVNLLGPYDEKLYAERSPVNFFENLQTPLLVINGTDDTRVPYSTMSGFVEKLKASNKPYRLLIHEGQGHHPVTREALLEDKRVTVEFLRDFVLEVKA